MCTFIDDFSEGIARWIARLDFAYDFVFMLLFFQIERIQNKTLYTQYDAKRKQIIQNNPKQNQNERVLWHGTAVDVVPSINAHGFNRSYCGKNGEKCNISCVF